MVKRIGVPVISMVGNIRSYLAHNSDVVLDISVKEEACPHDLAPTASTTATLALGDALAVTLLEKKEFTADDFAMFHPGGNLGKRLLLRIEELAVSGDFIPIVRTTASLKDAILEISTKRLGAACVLNEKNDLAGIITDGDLRRLLGKVTDVSGLTAEEVMSKNPKTAKKGTLATTVLQEMEKFNITQIIIVDEHKSVVGLVHLHDLVKAGIGGEASA
jgi:arabinose-5-phosphate isomerase